MGVTRFIPKNCLLSLLDSVHNLFVMCLSHSKIPVEWKTHKIAPIPKKGDLLQIINYRPISLLCILSKVLESIIYHKIIDFICPSINMAIFMKNKSCLTQLLLAFSAIHQAVDNKEDRSGHGLPELQKAFDTVPHNELLYKLWRVGVTGNLWCWFQSYLNGRSQSLIMLCLIMQCQTHSQFYLVFHKVAS